MRILDEVKVTIRSGSGGNGVVSFLRQKFVERGGPNGGNGGKGGDVIFVSTNKINTFYNFRYKNIYKSEDGSKGSGCNRTGKSGKELIIEVPIGTQIFSEDESILIYDFTKDQETFKILEGGKGGVGNAAFKSSTNRSPEECIKGEVGQEMRLSLKLKILSDIGIIGLPNAGKSTFLSKITNAKPKIADYPFTTLSPNLGIVKVFDEEVVIADIPGLIEGAHFGKGLGFKFLKHIERCKILIHVIDGLDEDVVASYKTVRDELNEYSKILSEKKSLVCINKTESIPQDMLETKVRDIENVCKSKVYKLSTAQSEGLNEILKDAIGILKNI